MLSVGGTAVIAYSIRAIIGLRPTAEAEETGLDDSDHGEAGYHGDEGGRGGLESLGLGAALEAGAPAPAPPLGAVESPS